MEDIRVVPHKKRDRRDQNYRPIWLTSMLHEMFTKIILSRLLRTLNAAYREQLAKVIICESTAAMNYCCERKKSKEEMLAHTPLVDVAVEVDILC